MSTKPAPFIERVVKHNGGVTATARAIGIAYQEVQRWIGRGWVTPRHAIALVPYLPEGVTLEKLLIEAAKKGQPTAAPRRARAEATAPVASDERRVGGDRRERPR